ncbi:hypothetical protein BHE74_00052438 [Ensete ventricosum]|nr:hypothetical protein BHE74_00052438 [Ensete ventricosum]
MVRAVYPSPQGGSTTESTQIPGYGWFNRAAWVGQPPSAARKPGRRRYTCRSPVTLKFLRSFLHNVCTLIHLPRLVVTSKYVRITPAFDWSIGK